MTDHETLEPTEESPADRSEGEAEIESGLITFRKICDDLSQPPHKIHYQIRVLNIKYEFKVGAARVFSMASFLRIKSGIMGVANKKAAKAI